MKLINTFLFNGIALLSGSLFIFFLFIYFNLNSVETPYQILIADESKAKVYQTKLSNKPIITTQGKEDFIKESIALFFNNNTKIFLNSLEKENKTWKELSVYIQPESRDYTREELIDFYEDNIDSGAELIKTIIKDDVYLTGVAKTAAGETLYRYSFRLNVLSIGLGGRSNDSYRATMVIKETNQYHYKGLAIESIEII